MTTLVKLMRSKSKQGHHKQYWDVWLSTRKQRLAAFTALLMLALGLIIGRHDYDQPHLHVDSGRSMPTTRVSAPASGNSTARAMTFSSYFGRLPGDRNA